jgi:hypothetical protein
MMVKKADISHSINQQTETPLAGDFYENKVIAMSKPLSEHPNITKFISDILHVTYNSFLGTSKNKFLIPYLSVSNTIKPSDIIESIKTNILILWKEVMDIRSTQLKDIILRLEMMLIV